MVITTTEIEISNLEKNNDKKNHSFISKIEQIKQKIYDLTWKSAEYIWRINWQGWLIWAYHFKDNDSGTEFHVDV